METLLLTLIFVCVIVGLLAFILQKIPLPAPFNWLLWVVVGVLCLLAVFNWMPVLPHGRWG